MSVSRVRGRKLEYICRPCSIMVRKNEHTFEKVNLTPASIAVLALLARSPGEKYYVREIASKTGVSVGGCHKVLGNLSAMGLVSREPHGKNLYYSIDLTNPAVVHFKIFINIQDLHKIIWAVRDQSTRIVLFGSCATGKDTMESDIDLLVISYNTNNVHRFMKRKWKGPRKISPIVMRPVEYIKLKQKDRPLYDEIGKGIILWRKIDL